jgi:hypothetical protein
VACAYRCGLHVGLLLLFVSLGRQRRRVVEQLVREREQLRKRKQQQRLVVPLGANGLRIAVLRAGRRLLHRRRREQGMRDDLQLEQQLPGREWLLCSRAGRRRRLYPAQQRHGPAVPVYELE